MIAREGVVTEEVLGGAAFIVRVLQAVGVKFVEERLVGSLAWT